MGRSYRACAELSYWRHVVLVQLHRLSHNEWYGHKIQQSVKQHLTEQRTTDGCKLLMKTSSERAGRLRANSTDSPRKPYATCNPHLKQCNRRRQTEACFQFQFLSIISKYSKQFQISPLSRKIKERMTIYTTARAG